MNSMRRFINITAAILSGMIMLAACSNSEDPITPSGDYSPIRGSFPQGTSRYDTIIETISKEYGVYLLYKDITEQDLNREWVTTGTGDIYVAGPEEERYSGAWNLPEEHLPFYVDFFSNSILPNISKEFAHSTFPVKIYMIDNLRTEPRDYGEEEEENDNVSTGSDPSVSIKLGTFDNWAISFKEDIIFGADPGYSMKQQICIFVNELLINSKEKGEITSPDEFWAGFNFAPGYSMNHVDPEKENYKYKLGFVDDINKSFGTGRLKEVWTRPYAPIETSCYYWEKDKYPKYDLFAAYLRNAMWLTPEGFEERYPKDLYPMIHEKYNIVVKYMKEKYGLDLVGLSYEPN